MSGYPKAGMPSPARNKLLSGIHAAKKRLGLDDATYRDMLERLTGKRSAGAMNDSELNEVLAHLNISGGQSYRRVVRDQDGPNAALVNKIRALWISLAQLGAVDDRRDAALLAFVERQTAKQALEFLTPIDCNKVIQALKDWAAREGVIWENNLSPGECVARALWRRLFDLGVVKIADHGALDAWACKLVRSPCIKAFGHLSLAEQHMALHRMGYRLREALRARAGQPG